MMKYHKNNVVKKNAKFAQLLREYCSTRTFDATAVENKKKPGHWTITIRDEPTVVSVFIPSYKYFVCCTRYREQMLPGIKPPEDKTCKTGHLGAERGKMFKTLDQIFFAADRKNLRHK